jgi:hypothetical protein
MSGNKVIKPVSFNITKTDDAAMLKHIARKNFSGYVKKLILADLQSKMQQPEQVEVVTHEIKQPEPGRLERMRQVTKNPAPPKINLPKH